MSEPVSSLRPSLTDRMDAVCRTTAGRTCLALVCVVFWGSAFPFIKLGYRYLSIDSADMPSILVFAGVRFFLGGLLVLALGSLLQRRWLTLPPLKKGGLGILGLGLWQTSLQYLFFYWAVAHCTGARGSILNASNSFMGVLAAHFLYKQADRLTTRKALGCAIGFAGVLLAVGTGGEHDLSGDLAMLMASLIFSLAGPLNKKICGGHDGFTVSGYNLLFGGLVLALVGLATGGQIAPNHWLAFPVLGALVLISAVGYTLWAILMKNNPVSKVSIFLVSQPVVTTLLSAVMLGENVFNPRYLAAMACVCVGIYLVNRAKKEA